jgi:hypothetical protein
MKTKISVYLHQEGAREPKTIEIPENGKVKDVLEICSQEMGIANDGSLNLFLLDEDLPEGKEHPVKDRIKPKAKIHCHRCQKVEVVVIYNGKTFQDPFPPSTKVSKIIKKAVKAFGISETDAADLVLRLADKTDLQEDDPIGAFVGYPECKIAVNLLHPNPVQG